MRDASPELEARHKGAEPLQGLLVPFLEDLGSVTGEGLAAALDANDAPFRVEGEDVEYWKSSDILSPLRGDFFSGQGLSSFF